MIPPLDNNYWNTRYLENQAGWDLGQVSPPLKNYFDQLTDKSLHILIPGAGNSYEAEYLHSNGFENVYVCDIAPEPLNNLKKRCPSFPETHLLLIDFFELNQKFDRIIEQTFFCAINPQLRSNYFKKMAELLNKNGQLVGLMFNDVLNTTHPPFGGNAEEYKQLCAPFLEVKTMSTATNSIKPRAGRELFIQLKPHESA